MRTETITLPWPSPPMRSNDRYGHWAQKARATKAVREAMGWAIKQHRPAPFTRPAIVTGVWTVTDRRVRDQGAMSPTVKGCIDQMVADGVLALGDSWQAVEERYRIELGDRPGFRIEIEEVSA